MNESPTDNIPVFYACIPELPDSPPFDIAWATLAFETYGVMCESRLIRPPAAWFPPIVNDPATLDAYGLRWSDLRAFGMPARPLAAHMNETLAGRELFSATVTDDDRIRRIFDAAKVTPEFALHKCDAEEVVAELARLRRLPADALGRAKREAQVMCLTGIRAEAKARYLATFWGFVARRR